MLDPADVSIIEKLFEKLGELLALFRRLVFPGASQRSFGHFFEVEILIHNTSGFYPAFAGKRALTPLRLAQNLEHFLRAGLYDINWLQIRTAKVNCGEISSKNTNTRLGKTIVFFKSPPHHFLLQIIRRLLSKSAKGIMPSLVCQ